MTGLDRWKEINIKFYKAIIQEKTASDVVTEILHDKAEYKSCRWCAYNNDFEKCGLASEPPYSFCKEGVLLYLNSEVQDNKQNKEKGSE